MTQARWLISPGRRQHRPKGHISTINRGLKEPDATILFRIAMVYGMSIEWRQCQMIVPYVKVPPIRRQFIRIQGRCQESPQRVRF
jgi:hypothetical protein